MGDPVRNDSDHGPDGTDQATGVRIAVRWRCARARTGANALLCGRWGGEKHHRCRREHTIVRDERQYLLKGAEGPELIRAVLAIASGDAVYGAAVTRRIVAFYSGAHQRYTAQVVPELTPRERDVLDLLATGARNHEIARRLELSEKTVRNHISALLLKLQVPDRTTAAARARDAGLGQS